MSFVAQKIPRSPNKRRVIVPHVPWFKDIHQVADNLTPGFADAVHAAIRSAAGKVTADQWLAMAVDKRVNVDKLDHIIETLTTVLRPQLERDYATAVRGAGQKTLDVLAHGPKRTSEARAFADPVPYVAKDYITAGNTWVGKAGARGPMIKNATPAQAKIIQQSLADIPAGILNGIDTIQVGGLKYSGAQYKGKFIQTSDDLFSAKFRSQAPDILVHEVGHHYQQVLEHAPNKDAIMKELMPAKFSYGPMPRGTQTAALYDQKMRGETFAEAFKMRVVDGKSFGPLSDSMFQSIGLPPIVPPVVVGAVLGPAPRVVVTGLFDMMDPKAISYAATRAGELITAISEDVRVNVRTVLARSMQGEYDVRATARLLQDVVGLTPRQANAVENFYRDLTLKEEVSWDKAGKMADDYANRLLRQRATTIARTETIRSSNFGVSQGFIQAQGQGLLPPEIERTWIVTADGDVCPECEALDGEQVGLDESFSSGDDAPPAHPSCRCAVGIVEA